ncbi:MAG: LuxR C-terminal-related transcriptional regulator [Luteolibacter sp.]
MEILTSKQVRWFSEAIQTIHRAETRNDVAEVTMAAVERLIGGEHGYFFEFFPDGGMQLLVQRTGAGLAALLPALAAFHRQHPGVRFCIEDPSGGSSQVSDFLGVAAWHRTDIYQEFCRPLGIEENCGVDFRPYGLNKHAIVLNRGRRNFSGRDRLMFDLLRPHATRALENVARRERIEAATDGRGIVMDADGRVLWMPEATRRLLERFFPGEKVSDRILPEEVLGWMRRQVLHWNVADDLVAHPPQPFQLSRSGRRLAIHCTAALQPGTWLLLAEVLETPDQRLRDLGLTRRQTDVLVWLAEGKANGEIATILGMSPETVKTHLKQIYQRLGIETRAAAIALVHRKLR